MKFPYGWRNERTEKSEELRAYCEDAGNSRHREISSDDEHAFGRRTAKAARTSNGDDLRRALRSMSLNAIGLSLLAPRQTPRRFERTSEKSRGFEPCNFSLMGAYNIGIADRFLPRPTNLSHPEDNTPLSATKCPISRDCGGFLVNCEA